MQQLLEYPWIRRSIIIVSAQLPVQQYQRCPLFSDNSNYIQLLIDAASTMRLAAWPDAHNDIIWHNIWWFIPPTVSGVITAVKRRNRNRIRQVITGFFTCFNQMTHWFKLQNQRQLHPWHQRRVPWWWRQQPAEASSDWNSSPEKPWLFRWEIAMGKKKKLVKREG